MMCKVLIFSCISAVMLITAAYGAPLSTESLLRALIRDLQILEKSKDKIHLDLYTPNEKQECSWQTLQCYLTEMGTLENEIEDEDVDNLRNIQKNLQSLMDLIPQGTGCKICEANDKKKFPAFHQELSNFLKSMLK
ncbi:interleukin-15-like [Nyctibius grandis]|uniref:interleukin-15-like n=1 Tax=Nyctibius grandis TaxID=48427 RepID=UPI0035BC5535